MVQGDGQISEAELAALADGWLSPGRRGQVAACVERSPIARIHTRLSPPPLHRLAA